MYRAPQSIAHRDLADAAATAVARHTEMSALAAASNDLLRYAPLTKYPTFETRTGPPRGVPMLPGRVDFQLQSYLTRSRRAAKDVVSFDRRASEWYPQEAPFVSFVQGNAARMVGREEVLLTQ